LGDTKANTIQRADSLTALLQEKSRFVRRDWVPISVGMTANLSSIIEIFDHLPAADPPGNFSSWLSGMTILLRVIQDEYDRSDSGVLYRRGQTATPYPYPYRPGVSGYLFSAGAMPSHWMDPDHPAVPDPAPPANLHQRDGTPD
jgi:hypothetical protein